MWSIGSSIDNCAFLGLGEIVSLHLTEDRLYLPIELLQVVYSLLQLSKLRFNSVHILQSLQELLPESCC